MQAVHLAHWIAAFIVMAEALNKLERAEPFACGLTGRQRAIEFIKTLAWLLLALGAGGAMMAPLLVPWGVYSAATHPLIHIKPSLAESCVMVGFAVLIVKTRIKEG